VSDITDHASELVGSFDLVLTWQALEHVGSMELALENIRAYLRPGGSMVAQISGAFAAFALLARVIPRAVASRAMRRLLDMDPETKFPTRYDGCHPSALEALLSRWTEHRIVPRYKGGAYFRFSRALERTYLAYENWIARSGHRTLATHYVIWAVT
jgi:hypothetical protein